jgi:ornithine carbamoyltransferase
MTTTPATPTHLLSLLDWSAPQLRLLLLRATRLKSIRKLRAVRTSLTGRCVALMFEKPSTRTRVSFEAGVSTLGGSTVVMQARDTQLGEGEPAKDAARVLGRYVDAIVARTDKHAVLEELARHAGVPVINGMTDHSHPCQVLGDVFSVMERRPDWAGLKYAFVGQGHSMANTWVEAACVLGVELSVATPSEYPVRAALRDHARKVEARITFGEDPVFAVRNADVVITDAWPAAEGEGAAKAIQALLPFQVNRALLAHAQNDALLLHRLPAHRGQEISEDVLEGLHSMVFDEAENRYYVQQAVLETLLASAD